MLNIIKTILIIYFSFVFLNTFLFKSNIILCSYYFYIKCFFLILFSQSNLIHCNTFFSGFIYFVYFAAPDIFHCIITSIIFTLHSFLASTKNVSNLMKNLYSIQFTCITRFFIFLPLLSHSFIFSSCNIFLFSFYTFSLIQVLHFI